MYLTEIEKKAIIERLGSEIPLILTGSYSDGSESNQSDIDIVALDPDKDRINAIKLRPDNRNIDVILYPRNLLQKMAETNPNVGKPLYTVIECSVLNAISHGLPLNGFSHESLPHAFKIEPIVDKFIENKLYLTGAAIGSFKRMLSINDIWGSAIILRQIANGWTDTWLAEQKIFIAKEKWRIRYLRNYSKELYREYLKIQFPSEYSADSKKMFVFLLESLIHYMNLLKINKLKFKIRTEQIMQEVSDVKQLENNQKNN